MPDSTQTPPPPVGPYRPVVRAGDFLIVSGQIGIANGTLAEGVLGQLSQAIANLRGHLEGAGASLADVVKTTVFLTDMADFDAVNRLYVEAFDEPRPARSAVAVSALPLGAAIEIEAWAFVPAR